MSRAEAQSLPAPRFFVTTWVGHGGLSTENTYPLDATSTLATQTLYPAQGTEPEHLIRSGRLLDLRRTHDETAGARQQPLEDLDGGAARVSPLLGAFLSDTLLSKMNVMRGVDFLGFGGHTRGYLGNFRNNDGDDVNGVGALAVPTVDYVISQSNSFYSPGERAVLRAPVITNSGPHLSTFRSGAGVARNPHSAQTAGQLFDRLFSGVQSQPGQVDPRAALVDRVHADYARTARGAFGAGRRISREDRLRLEEHMASVAAIGDRLRATVSAGCTVPSLTTAERAAYPRNGEADWEWTNNNRTPAERRLDQRGALELLNMLLVTAFNCGTTRMAVLTIPPLLDQWDPATFNTPSMFETQRTDAHGMVFHNHFLPDRQRHLILSQRFFFEHGFADLIRRMDALQVVPGVTMLDQAVAYWGSESGPSTHDAKCLPTILAGGGGGWFTTGNYVDYTHRTRNIRGQYGNMWRAGIPQNQLLANIARAMGLQPSEYELSDAAFATKFPARGGRMPGYGEVNLDTTNDRAPYPPAMVNDMSEKLAVVTT